MNDTNTLNPFSTKPREVKVTPQNQIGGSFESFETSEAITTAVPDLFKKAFAGGVNEASSIFSDISDLWEKDIAGEKQDPGTMPAAGSIEFQNVAKTPELLEKEKAAQYNRVVYSSMEEARKNAQGFAHEKILDEIVRLEVAGMSTEEKNKTLHVSLDLSENNTQDAYHIHALREKKKEELMIVEEQAQTANEAEVKPNTIMGEGELLKGGENQNHFTKAVG